MKTRAAILTRMGAPAPYAESRPIEVADVELLPPGVGEVLLRMRAAGLCHSDLSVIDGNRPRPLPMVLGHEGAGIVEEVGPGVKDLVVGDHVVTAFVPSCGHCSPCESGRPALCEPGLAANTAGTLLSGTRRLRRNALELNHHMGVSAFAEYTTVSRQSVVKVDRSLGFAEAAVFGCAVITGTGAVINTAQLPLERSVAVIGLGGVGLAALLEHDQQQRRHGQDGHEARELARHQQQAGAFSQAAGLDHGEVDEDARQVEQTGEPGYDHPDVERLYDEHAFLLALAIPSITVG